MCAIFQHRMGTHPIIFHTQKKQINIEIRASAMQLQDFNHYQG